MFCKKCSAEVGSDSNFCSSCGAPIVLGVPQKPVVEMRPSAAAGSSAEDSSGGLTLDEMYRAFVGRNRPVLPSILPTVLVIE